MEFGLAMILTRRPLLSVGVRCHPCVVVVDVVDVCVCLSRQVNIRSSCIIMYVVAEAGG